MSRDKRKKSSDPGRRTPPEWLAVHLDFPPDVWEGGLRMELRGRNALTVCGCRRILAYHPEEIRLAVKNAVLCVKGERLICTSYLAGAVGIDGLINAMIFDSEDTPSEGREKP